MRKVRFLAPILAVTALLSACGGGASTAKLNPGDVAVVGNQHLTKAQFNQEMEAARLSYQQAKQAFPKSGTSAYVDIQGKAVVTLVAKAEFEQKAKQMGITVTNGEIETQLNAIKQQYFGGSEKKYDAQLKKEHLTDAVVRADVRDQILESKVYAKVTKGINVSKADIAAYYNSHLSSYGQAESRGAQYILVKSKSLADSIYQQLKSGNEKTWCTLAKKYSEDPSSKNECGKATFTKGQTVKVFDTTLFSSPTGVVHAPVYDATQYKAWFVIRPTTDPKPAKTTPLSQVSASIKETLLQQDQNNTITQWQNDLSKSYCKSSKIKYQIGYAPTTDPCTALTTSTATTTTAP